LESLQWVIGGYKIKTRADGFFKRNKACLVAKGFTLKYGTNYEETFSPIARFTSIKFVLFVDVIRRWSLFQMDVKNTFLNVKLLEV
jgi:hypothetical protein